ncbi:hypothetical protein [Corynebacterium urealyticum]|uniref:hypothetical protein n=1 Tax=Corynebacterium urealyticum TaxID=43771 RepID=UPI0002B3F2FA|nr:hypothetical protein [Corynebacterium urealyticum]AGE36608.1 hypothetical protein CU7111_1015 [Corynebacterium urealyticum DSM 7111]QQB08243.1 hypothetical protein I6H53_03765 [Corynebacterium urealyticum]
MAEHRRPVGDALLSDWPPDVREAATEFIENLRMMATGSYLRAEEREHWDPPYPESAVDEAQAELVTIGEAILGGADPQETSLAGVRKIIAISDANGGLLLDSEELDELLVFLSRLTATVGGEATVVCDAVRELVEE